MQDVRLLDGITIVDFSTAGPGPRCTRILADYGARLIKVRPTAQRNRLREPPSYAYSSGRDVERICVDLTSDEGREVVRRLAVSADVVVESFRPGVAARIGIGYDEMQAVRPKLVYCSVSGFGQSGPYAKRPGHDLNYLGVAGFLSTSGSTLDGRPALPGAPVADAAGGFAAATAILAALTHVRGGGEGSYLDVSTVEAALRVMVLFLDEFLTTGNEIGPNHHRLLGGLACYDIYATADNRFVTLAALEPGFWKRLCELLELEDMIAIQLEPEAQERIRLALRDRFASRTRDEWVALLGEESCVGPVNTLADVLNDPQLLTRGSTWTVPHTDGSSVRQMAPNLAGAPSEPTATSIIRHQAVTDTDRILEEVGYPAIEIARLREAGVVE